MTLRRALKRLRLKAGDILLLHHSISFQRILNTRDAVEAPVPILFFENKGDIARLPFEVLEKLYLEAKELKNAN